VTTMNTTEFRRTQSEALDRVFHHGERIALARGKKTMAVLVSPDDLELLRALEDRLDIERIKQALAEIEESGTSSWDDFMEEMGL